MFAANFSAPTIKVKEGQKLYLTLTNVGMMARPDLFDPHTVHYHGFPNASAVFDGVPDASIAINMGSSLTYFYYNAEPGTFIYHCHVEAAEHMQMGMLGQLYVTPLQDGTSYSDPDGSGRVYTKFAYNDGDGSTGYDVDFPIQIASFDPVFHDAAPGRAAAALRADGGQVPHAQRPRLPGHGQPDSAHEHGSRRGLRRYEPGVPEGQRPDHLHQGGQDAAADLEPFDDELPHASPPWASP